MGKLRKYGIIFLVLLMALAAAPMAMAATATEIGQGNIGDLFMAEGDYILSEDIVLSGTTKAIELSKDIEVTLDLNGHTISADTSTYRNLENAPKDYGSIIYATSGDITIKDGVGGGKICDTSAESYHGDGVIRVEKGTHLTIEKAIIEVKEGVGITAHGDGTRVTFKDGEIKVEYGFGIGTNGLNITEPGSGIYVEGGTITVASADSAAIYHPSSGTLNISGGTLSAADGIQVKAGRVIITGGTITATGKHNVPLGSNFSDGGTNELGNALSLISHASYKGQSMDVAISGSAMLIAEQDDAIGVYVNSGDVSHVNSFVITGGTYSSDPSAYVESPYVVKQVEGKYVVALAGVAVTPTAAELVLGLTPTAKLTASSDIEEAFTWASKNDDVVTVDSSGNITAVGAGTADVTATGDSSKSVGTCVVTVRAATPVSVTPSKMELNIGATGKATAKYDAKDSITWESSDTAVATVKDGTVTAVKAGIAVITANGSKTSAACTVTVTDPAAPDPVTPTPAPVDAGTVDKENNPVNKEEGKPENVEAATPAITEATEEGKAAVVSATKIEKEPRRHRRRQTHDQPRACQERA
ncbi:MAG: Ig domain-containing protein [Cloacibacillus evryensis]